MQTREILRLSWRAWLSRSTAHAGPWWLGLMWTLLFSLVIAAFFTVSSMLFAPPSSRGSVQAWWAVWRVSLVMSLTIGLCIRIVFHIGDLVVGRNRLARARPWQRSLYYMAAPIVAMAVGWPLGMYWAMGIDARRFFTFERPAMGMATIAAILLITAIFQQFFASKARQIRAEDQAAEARLRLLQAQIEPHFLFNTLANVVSLMDSDTGRAKLMLESFVDYLRASLSGLGGAERTLGDEVDLVETYLRIIKIRMDDRLDYAIDVPAGLRGLPLPALTLQPLVENAIVHGLEPRIAGGCVTVRARLERRTLVLTVDDDGGGLAPTTAPRPRRAGAGTALANIRERLRQLHGDAATLRVEAAEPHGVCARLSLPVSSA